MKKTATIYLTDIEYKELVKVCDKHETDLLKHLTELSYVGQQYSIKVNEEQLSHLMYYMNNIGSVGLRNKMQEAGRNIFQW